jgi:hypothetical protein
LFDPAGARSLSEERSDETKGGRVRFVSLCSLSDRERALFDSPGARSLSEERSDETKSGRVRFVSLRSLSDRG